MRVFKFEKRTSTLNLKVPETAIFYSFPTVSPSLWSGHITAEPHFHRSVIIGTKNLLCRWSYFFFLSFLKLSFSLSLSLSLFILFGFHNFFASFSRKNHCGNVSQIEAPDDFFSCIESETFFLRNFAHQLCTRIKECLF